MRFHPHAIRRLLRTALGLAAVLLLLAGLGGPPEAAPARTIAVPADAATVAEAVRIANPGDRIVLSAGTYNEEVLVDKPLEISGAGAGATVLQGLGGRTLTVSSCLSLKDLTVSGGNDGVFVTAGASLEMRGVTVTGNPNHGVFFELSKESATRISESVITGNGDGINLNATRGRITNNEITSNSDDGIDIDGDVDVRISGNRISGSGDDGIEIRLSETTRAVIGNNQIDGSGEDSVEVIESFHMTCRNRPSLCANELRIRGNTLTGSARYGLGFVELPSESKADFPIPLGLQCAGNAATGNGSGEISPNYDARCSAAFPSGTVLGRSPPFAWKAVAGAEWYLIQTQDSAGKKFRKWYRASEAGCSAGAGICSVKPALSLAPGAGGWKFRTWNSADGNGPWSSEIRFSVERSAPVPTWPIGRTCTATPAYAWEAVPGAGWYQLWVDDSSGNRIRKWYRPADLGCGGGTGTCTVRPAIALTAGAASWWVREWNSAEGSGPWSAAQPFRVVPPPAAGGPISPAGAVADTTPTYTWLAEPNAEWYQLSVDDSSGNRILRWFRASDAGCAGGTGSCATTPADVLAAGPARWRVRTWNSADGNGPWGGYTAFSVTPPLSAPVGLAPSGPIAVPLPTFTWKPVAGAPGYEIWVEDAARKVYRKWFEASAVGCAGGSGNCSVRLDEPILFGPGKWWVRASDGRNHGGWSAGVAFAITSPLAAPILVSPSGAVADPTPVYTWNAVAGAEWYRLWVDDRTGNRIKKWFRASDLGCGGGTGTCSVEPSVPLVAGPARWWARAWSATDSHGPSSAEMAFTLDVALARPVLLSPSGATSGGRPAYAWKPLPGAEWYQLWVDDSTGNRIRKWYRTAELGCGKGTGTCSIAPEVSLSAGPGKWWVRGWNAGAGSGPWSAAMEISVDLPLHPLTLISPSGTIADTTPVFTWNALADAEWYQLWVDDSTGNRLKKWLRPLDLGCGGGTGTCSVRPSPVLNAGAGKWWVRGWNSAQGSGPWSSGMPFSVAP